MNKNIPLLSVLYGEEDFLIDKHIQDIITTVLPAESRALGLEVYENESATITNIINACQSLGMFATTKVVVVKNFYLLKNTKTESEPSKNEEFEIANLKAVLRNLSSDTYLIFVVYGNVDNRKKFVKHLKELSEFSEYKPFASWEGEKVVNWVNNWVKKNGKEIEETAAFRLHTIVGENLRLLDNEIQKLITFIGKNDRITVTDVDTVVSSAGANSFQLLDCLVEGKTALSMELISKILYHGEEPIKLLGLIVSHFRGLLMIKSLYEGRTQFGDIAKMCGKHPFIVKNTIGMMKNVTSSDFVKIMDMLCQTDLAIKTGQLKPDIALELLCQDILSITKK
ncbi:MAG: DNA polymerase III subunit delta [Candidatus Margulisbacteria bacterium GWF2_38_17]|nr:MAG: DNA polymerase III subunit delta [Candidatus Margulisbacteria bacterium GWD2_39_127]OGI04418.1 MAG: DNA polymerase III subunit delta [Candidatus Margulisbacteria bacterium GWF2_38_17]OGI07860.1 MAG: DNA polymerase III subunit delta [Candidatus Margulisbacteria bacterium GWE2_39_32]